MISVTSAALEGWIAALLWPFVRILALIATAPVLHDNSVPRRLKIALALAVTVLVAPLLPPPAVGLSSPQAVAVLAEQVLLGAALGFAMRIVFAAVELAGEMIGLQMGLSFAGFLDPQSGNPVPLVASFLGLVASLVFLAINGHLMLIAAVTESFAVWPVGAAGAKIDLPKMVGWGGEVFRLGLHLSLPVLATLLLINVALGVLARAAPQLNLLAVGFPATLLAGFLLLSAMLPVFIPALQRALEGSLQMMLR
jgi:flagellar biosynthetic protein FliR